MRSIENTLKNDKTKAEIAIEKFNKKTQIENQKESERWEKEQIEREERRKENIKENIMGGISETLIFIIKAAIMLAAMWYGIPIITCFFNIGCF